MAHAKNGCRNRAIIWKVQPDPSEVERSVVTRQPVLWSQRTFSASEKRQRNDRTRCEPNSGAITHGASCRRERDRFTHHVRLTQRLFRQFAVRL